MVAGLDLILRLWVQTGISTTRMLLDLPILRWDPGLNVSGETFGDLAALAVDPKMQEVRPMVFRTDSAGLRNTHGSEEIDLLVMGDSFGAGIGTTQEGIFASLLATQYRQRVYNISYPGGPWTEYLDFLHESPRITFTPNAKVVWVLFAGNDLYDFFMNIWDPAALSRQHGLRSWMTQYQNFRSRAPLREPLVSLRRRLFGERYGSRVIKRELPNGQPILFLDKNEELAALPQTIVEHYPSFSNIERTLGVMQKLAAERALDLTVIIIPSKGEVYRWILDQRDPRPEDAQASGFEQALLEVCTRLKLRCLNTKLYLIKEASRLFESSGELLWWRDDTHLNDRGHQAIADFIAREILSIRNPPFSSLR
jgi:hypothetical protein